jgi:osmoprotectant transport system permease protein
MSDQAWELLQKLPEYLGGHIVISLCALAIGFAVSVPVGVVASRRAKLAEWALSLAGIVQTVPSLALLALMVLLLNGRIGFWPSFFALVLYSILPILANTIVGIRGVEPALTEAARGLGMNPLQVLWRVELPLAAPKILSGLRTATILVVGTATLVTTVGGASLGNYIFEGLEGFNDLRTVFGCVLAALLAVWLDQLVHLFELAALRRSRRWAWAGVVGLVLTAVIGLYFPVRALLDARGGPTAVAEEAESAPTVFDATYAQFLENLPDMWDALPRDLGGHMALSLSALAAGLLISIPLGIVGSRRPRLAECSLAVAGVIQTVPTLALLALMVLLLRGRIGFRPSFLALLFYSLLPILANTIAGIRGVEPALVEAARGLGMTNGQLLRRVQLPLALPTIIAGVRTATVLVVGTAVLVTPVGGRSLGNYIFSGMESLNYAETLFGCVLGAALAVLLDQLIHLLESAARERSRAKAWMGLGGLSLVVAGSLCYPTLRLLDARTNSARIASGSFTEQHILNELVGLHLRQAQPPFHPDQRRGMSEGMQLKGLFHSQIDCIVYYSGNYWTLVMKENAFVAPEVMEQRIREHLRGQGVHYVGRLGFENAYAFAMPKSAKRPAEFQHIHTVDDLARYAAAAAQRNERPLAVGGDMQFFGRPEWVNVKSVYQLDEAWFKTVAMDPTRMYDAVDRGEVDAIVAYSSDGRIPRYELEILTDTRAALPRYDAILLVSQRGADKPGLLDHLHQLVGKITLEDMQNANRQVDLEKRPVRDVAAELLDKALPQRAPQ